MLGCKFRVGVGESTGSVKQASEWTAPQEDAVIDGEHPQRAMPGYQACRQVCDAAQGPSVFGTDRI